MFAQLTIIEGVQDQPDGFREQFVAPDGEAQRALLAVPLCDADSLGWLPFVTFGAKGLDDSVIFSSDMASTVSSVTPLVVAPALR